MFKAAYPDSLTALVDGTVELQQQDTEHIWFCVRTGPLRGTVIEQVHGGTPSLHLISPGYVQLHTADGLPGCTALY